MQNADSILLVFSIYNFYYFKPFFRLNSTQFVFSNAFFLIPHKLFSKKMDYFCNFWCEKKWVLFLFSVWARILVCSCNECMDDGLLLWHSVVIVLGVIHKPCEPSPSLVNFWGTFPLHLFSIILEQPLGSNFIITIVWDNETSFEDISTLWIGVGVDLDGRSGHLQDTLTWWKTQQELLKDNPFEVTTMCRVIGNRLLGCMSYFLLCPWIWSLKLHVWLGCVNVPNILKFIQSQLITLVINVSLREIKFKDFTYSKLDQVQVCYNS